MNLKVLAFALLLTACSTNRSELGGAVLLETDLAFSALSEEKGMVEAFLTYADEEVIKLQDKAFPLWGKKAMQDAYSELTDSTFTLTWVPLKAEIAASNDFGYTFGNWTLVRSNGTTVYGNYVSIWKKQADGSWKYVLDTGTETPAAFVVPEGND